MTVDETAVEGVRSHIQLVPLLTHDDLNSIDLIKRRCDLVGGASGRRDDLARRRSFIV